MKKFKEKHEFNTTKEYRKHRKKRNKIAVKSRKNNK